MPELKSEKKRRLALIGVCVLYLYSMLYTFALPVMYPSMLSQYGLMPYYALFGVISISISCISTPLGGKLCDTVGRKRLFLITGCLRLVLMVLCGIRTTALVFSILYLSSSTITGFMYAVPLSILSDLTSPSERPRYFGIFGTITGVSLLAGILLCGIITDNLGAFSMFFLFVPILLAALILIGFFYTDPHRSGPKEKLDVIGCLLMTVCLAALIIWCNFGGSAFPWLSLPSIGLLLTCAAAFVLFLRQEKHHPSPLLDLAVFSDRNFCLSFLCGFFIAPMVSLCSGSLVFYGQVALGLSSTVSSTLAMPKNILYLILPTFLGVWISKNSKHYRTAFLCCGSLIVTAGLCACFWSTSTSLIAVYLVMLLFGLATSCQSVSLQPYMQLTIPSDRVGIASSLISFSTTLGSALCSTINTIYYNARYTIDRAVPEQLRASMSQEQLTRLIAPDTLKNVSALESLRTTIPAELLSGFDQAVGNLRQAGADVFRLMSVLTAASGAAIIFATLFLCRNTKVRSVQ